MGMFDTVLVPCPECGTEEEFQTKSGDCLLATYTLEEAPPDVLGDINRHAPATCGKCGTLFGVRLDVKAVPAKWPIAEEPIQPCGREECPDGMIEHDGRCGICRRKAKT
jgi:hypothetical protein